MSYSLETCSLYEKKIINTIPIFIFSSHNMALPVWGDYASKINSSLGLISFDHHADTHDPFAAKIGIHDFEYRNFEKNIFKKMNYQIDNYCFEDVLKLSCEYVANDEHILTAYKFNYINGYHIFCELPNDEIESYQWWDRRRNINASYYAKNSIKDLTYEILEEISEPPFILDFDLDYFNTPKIFDELFIDKISFLIKKATVITIAREPKYFELEKTDAYFENNRALELLLNVIQKALN